MQEMDPDQLSGPNTNQYVRNHVENIKRRLMVTKPCTKMYTHYVANFTRLPKTGSVSLKGDIECTKYVLNVVQCNVNNVTW